MLVRIDMGEVENVFFTPVADDVVAHVDMLRALSGHVVGGHADASFIIFVKEDRLMYADTEFTQKRPNPDNCVAGVSDSSVLGCRCGLRRYTRLELA